MWIASGNLIAEDRLPICQIRITHCCRAIWDTSGTRIKGSRSSEDLQSLTRYKIYSEDLQRHFSLLFQRIQAIRPESWGETFSKFNTELEENSLAFRSFHVSITVGSSLLGDSVPGYVERVTGVTNGIIMRGRTPRRDAPRLPELIECTSWDSFSSTERGLFRLGSRERGPVKLRFAESSQLLGRKSLRNSSSRTALLAYASPVALVCCRSKNANASVEQTEIFQRRWNNRQRCNDTTKLEVCGDAKIDGKIQHFGEIKLEEPKQILN